MSKPKILTIDIETAPLLGYVWGLWDNNVALNQIHSDWYIMSFAAKWMDSDEVIYFDQRDQKNMEDDRVLLKKVWKLLDQADVVITQNGKSFDEKKINARFILNGMKPTSPYRSLDTLLIAKRKFAFTSNKLEYMSKALNKKYKKLSHHNFEGFKLWTECLKGNIKAWREMERYNKHDVLATEELYLKLQPWDNKLQNNLYTDSIDLKCDCGSVDFKKNGHHFTETGKFQRYVCLKCGASQRDKTNLFTKEKKASLRKRL